MQFDRKMIEPELKALYNQDIIPFGTEEVYDHQQFDESITALLDFYQNVSLKRIETIDILDQDQGHWKPEQIYEVAVNQFYFLLDERGKFP
jgi:hypothetical protein